VTEYLSKSRFVPLPPCLFLTPSTANPIWSDIFECSFKAQSSCLYQMIPAVEPGYWLFVERSADPIDNPARLTPVAPYRVHNTSSESNWRTRSCVLPFTHKTKTVRKAFPNLMYFSRRVPRLCMVTAQSSNVLFALFQWKETFELWACALKELFEYLTPSGIGCDKTKLKHYL